MSTRLIMFVVSVISLVFIVGISRSIYSLWQKGSVVSERKQEETSLRQKNDELKQKLAQVQSPEFIETQAREKLNLQREGEVIVVLPTNLPEPEIKTQDGDNLPNWQKWWRLFN